MPLVSCLYDRFVNFLLGEFGVCGASRFRSTSSPESVSDSRPPSISSEALPYFSCNSLDDGPGFLDRSAVSSSSLYLLATLLRTPAKTQDMCVAPVCSGSAGAATSANDNNFRATNGVLYQRSGLIKIERRAV